MDDATLEDLSEDEADEAEEKLELDYQLGEDFKDKIIPRAVDYFTGKALQYDMMEDDDDYEDIDDDEDDEDEDEVIIRTCASQCTQSDAFVRSQMRRKNLRVDEGPPKDVAT